MKNAGKDWALSIWLERPVRIFRRMQSYIGKSDKNGIPRKVLINRSIWILPGITENSSQMECAHSVRVDVVSTVSIVIRRKSEKSENSNLIFW